MSVSREVLVAGNGTFGASTLASQLARKQLTLAQRLPLRQSVQEVNASMLCAVASVRKARSPSYPRSWFFQAAIPSVSQKAIDKAQANDPGEVSRMPAIT